mmetsp:Transcript_19128/g.52743  ORF Transcript_19128/g.52743 Transcript_19128/m.52743 type:complete len:249 (+) Transcript_19128:154-900(+)
MSLVILDLGDAYEQQLHLADVRLHPQRKGVRRLEPQVHREVPITPRLRAVVGRAVSVLDSQDLHLAVLAHSLQARHHACDGVEVYALAAEVHHPRYVIAIRPHAFLDSSLDSFYATPLHSTLHVVGHNWFPSYIAAGTCVVHQNLGCSFVSNHVNGVYVMGCKHQLCAAGKISVTIMMMCRCECQIVQLRIVGCGKQTIADCSPSLHFAYENGMKSDRLQIELVQAPDRRLVVWLPWHTKIEQSLVTV